MSGESVRWLLSGGHPRSHSQRWRIRLPGRLYLYCDKDGKTFYSREHAESTLDLIGSEMHPENFRFDPSFYRVKKETSGCFQCGLDNGSVIVRSRRNAIN